MALVHEIRRRGRHILPQVLLVATLGYFGYHIVQGEHGVLAWLQPHVPPEMIWPVRIYTAVISLMVITAFGTRGAGATPLIVAGACMFFLSDLSVAALRFTEPSFPTYVLGLPLYYAAQICLALSVAASSSRDPSKAPR